MIIERRFNGPPDTGNGGYTAGMLASHLMPGQATAVEVTLRVPPPLDTPLRVHDGDGQSTAYLDGQLVAEARRAPELPDPPVPPVGFDEATRAAAGYPGLTEHPFPTCYVCGVDRPSGDGLRIFPGPLPDGRTAAPWEVPDDVTSATVWAALDCPGGWSIIGPGRPYVLGRITAVLGEVPPIGARCVLVGALISAEGRKAQVRTSLYREGHPEPVARAAATWIAV